MSGIVQQYMRCTVVHSCFSMRLALRLGSSCGFSVAGQVAVGVPTVIDRAPERQIQGHIAMEDSKAVPPPRVRPVSQRGGLQTLPTVKGAGTRVHPFP
jgi:hypothetical protein